LIAGAVGLFIIVLGVWAMIDPRSFFDQLANYPPYNKHLFHDVGAFQVGIGTSLLLAAFMRDAILLGLTAGAVGSILHAVSHFIDRDLGGRSSDPWLLSLLALVIVAGVLLRAYDRRAKTT
jgi:hypothetical protein